MDPLWPLRRIKHQAWMTSRRLERLPDDARRRRARSTSYRYEPEDHVLRIGDVGVPASATFQVDHLLYPSIEHEPRAMAPEVLFAAWMGDNDLTPARRTALESLQEANPDLPLVLVTQDDLDDYIVDGAPLHPAFRDLSAMHRSDYIRAYLMHHHGGAYVDLKIMRQPWSPVFDRLNSTPDVWAAGPPEVNSWNASPAKGPLGKEQKRNFPRMAFQAAFAFKPGSSWTSEWLAEVDRRMDYFQRLLADHPAVDPYGHRGGYPVPWSSLMGQVFSPLALKYAHRFEPWPQMHFEYPSGGYR